MKTIKRLSPPVMSSSLPIWLSHQCKQPSNYLVISTDERGFSRDPQKEPIQLNGLLKRSLHINGLTEAYSVIVYAYKWAYQSL